MQKLLIISFAFALGLSVLLIPQPSQAGCCGCDPVYDNNVVMEVKSAVWVRDEACVATGDIIDTLKTGEVVQVTHRTDGWFKVISPRGKVGWSGEQFLRPTSKPLSSTSCTTCNTTPEVINPVSDPNYSAYSLSHTKGYILLQVQELGEAWYVDPVTFKRYYMKDGATAYEMMRSFGLGITDVDLAKIPIANNTTEMKNASSVCSYNSMANRVKGKIVLQVQQNGEGWYIYPKNCRRIYMKDGTAAYGIMRYLGLGITNSDLSRLSTSEVEIKPYTEPTTPTTPTTEPITNPTSNLGLTLYPASTDHAEGSLYTSYGPAIAGTGNFQKGSVPSGFNYAVLNQYFLDRINMERTSRGMPAILSDQRMVDSASVWAEQMYFQQQMTHTRQPVNMMARVWVWENFKIEFRETWGWLYENIGGGSYNRSQGINESVMSSMDSLLDYFMSEESYNGIHYQTIMHDKLTHVGLGFYFEGSNDSGKLWTVMHYGGLYGQVPVINKTW